MKKTITTIKKPRRGEIWKVNFNPTKGKEIMKTRPAIVIANDDVRDLLMTIVVPLTEWKDEYEEQPWMVPFVPNEKNKLTKLSAANPMHVRGVSFERFDERMGFVTDKQLYEVLDALAICVNYISPSLRTN